jgi:ABC-type phosphate transport system permease subunit
MLNNGQALTRKQQNIACVVVALGLAVNIVCTVVTYQSGHPYSHTLSIAIGLMAGVPMILLNIAVWRGYIYR